jgi:hypothetical protein
LVTMETRLLLSPNGCTPSTWREGRELVGAGRDQDLGKEETTSWPK